MTRIVIGRLVAGVLALLAFHTAPALAAAPHDWDGDGFIADDCMPLDAAGHPGAPDLPDLAFRDTNCDGIDGNKATAVWVGPNGADAAAGTLAEPLRTVQAALLRSTQVYVIAGTYTEHVVLFDGANVYGGYAADGKRARTN